ESGTAYFWQVRIWDDQGTASRWSDPAFFETGLLSPEDWSAEWIEPGVDEDPRASNPAPMLRRAFTLDGDVAQARLYATARGLYEVEINGRRVGDWLLTPGWTSYDHRIQYQTYDVTEYLRDGDNAIGAWLGDGWYRGRLGWENARNNYGTRLAFLGQLEITYTDGRRETIATDASWKSATGPILISDLYDGEVYDARMEAEGWSTAGFDDSAWKPVRLSTDPAPTLVAQIGPPVRAIQELRPIEKFTTPEGDLVFDMGQNMVGHVRLRVSGPAGTRVTLRHAEVLDSDGNFYTDNLRTARQEVVYVLKGDGEELHEPRFTFQGFRYVAVEGYPGDPPLDAITGIVVHSDVKPTSTFETSNPLINQLHHNIVWGQKGNFVDVPTDCPQRDERLGWTGDAQAFGPTAAFNHDVAAFFLKWLGDLSLDQKSNGAVPNVIPDVLSRAAAEIEGSSGWADAATIVPWTMYLAYGDTRFLEQQYESMKAWVGYIERVAGPSRVWNTGWHFGDWLAFATTRSDYPGATTDKDLLATAFFAHSTDILRRSAEVLGKSDDARRYAALLDEIKSAFRREFVTDSGRLASNTQTAYALALAFDLLPPEMETSAAARLAADVNAHGHLTTGFLGTPHLAKALSDHGYLDVAYRLLLREQYPSWLYPITQGATTIWERWDGQKPDGTFQDVGMNSFNHYAYGAIGDWMYSTLAGLSLDPAAPGYRHSLIQPKPGGGFTRASASHESIYGTVGSAWTWENGVFTLEATVPPNTTATVRLPGAAGASVTEGGAPVAEAAGVRDVREEGVDVVVEVGSGTYRFAYPR
ncbi:MAG TPA: glycoside hydrolase family 78 protein, partial [Rhodothermales bacterium]